MGLFSKLSFALGTLVLGCLAASQAQAAPLTFTGTFTSDDQVQLYAWTLPQASAVTLATNSYGSGGFVPVVSLFDGSGNLITSDGGDATCSGGMVASTGTGICNDAYIATDLAAGNYTVALTEFFNVPVGPNISDGFLEQGAGNFSGPTCGTTGAFFETDLAPCVQRTGSFSLALATTPEPATFWLALPALAIGLLRRKRNLALTQQ